jgi:hypothetical protein
VIALLHDAQLHEHGPATLRGDQRHDGPCPGGRCQASDEAAMSAISRSRACVSAQCVSAQCVSAQCRLALCL